MKKYIQNIFYYIPVLFKLGLDNVLYIAWYRFSIKISFRKKFFPIYAFIPKEDIFTPANKIQLNVSLQSKEKIIEDADKIMSGQLKYFNYHWKKVGSPPNWFFNPFNDGIVKQTHLHWTKLPDFDPEIGDIKNIWEASRFDWVVKLAKAYAITQDQKYIDTLNQWLSDWIRKNPVNQGPNWKCGQEASIRVFNLINASFILKPEDSNKDFFEFIYMHLLRISSNIRYAIAQNNNHGTSEAAALFIGAAWLQTYGSLDLKELSKLKSKGRYWLENRIKKLIDKDGSFSQHSTNYHRVLIDTLSFAEFWRKKLIEKPFSSNFYEKASAAVNWLIAFTDEKNGKVPNLGSNDGALLLNLTSCDYRDFRPSIQLAAAQFLNKRVYNSGDYDESLEWLNLAFPENILNLQNRNSILDKAYCIMYGVNSRAFIRLPKFKFRPSHNDVFHFDLWLNGENIFCDNGSYSYNQDKDNYIDFKSVHMHNTASFDGGEQMIRLGRFLLGKWIKPIKISSIKEKDNIIAWEGNYIDYKKNKHNRRVELLNNKCVIEDIFVGNFKKAEIGFNLPHKIKKLDENKIELPWGRILVQDARNIEIIKVYISNYYWQKEEVNRLVISSNEKNKITTIIEFANENTSNTSIL